ncbi:LuxR C-terminal-related transcriptional regulator [Actinoallomurus sp. NBC_01490]|uniref:helix-turn-helix domain-containing protein n=1 Tax=Actinoallomurus sp. NBC_01490 TaxID=2903557 RepID=UPI002E2EE88E|nr:helix-turn-helix domain-containing protein [Actinoallomurus sp. NBC_01490]
MWDAVGISGNDGAVYEALVRRGQAEAGDIAGDLALPRGQVARVLRRIAERGLVTRLPGRPVRYTAVAPDLAAGSLIAERERDLVRLRAHAQRLTAEHAHRRDAGRCDPADLVEIIDGGVNVQNAFVRLQRAARKQIRTFDRPPYLENPVTGNPEQYHHASQRGLAYRVLYHQSALEIPGRMDDVWRRIQHGERARVSSHVPMKMVLCDNQRALLPVTSGGNAAEAAYLVHPSSMLDAFSELFEALWERAVPINRVGAGDDEKPPVDPELLGLLASGATDETIARVLGWSVRTVHRHVHRMMTHVGAETRFQAGMEAVRRGWA